MRMLLPSTTICPLSNPQTNYNQPTLSFLSHRHHQSFPLPPSSWWPLNCVGTHLVRASDSRSKTLSLHPRPRPLIPRLRNWYCETERGKAKARTWEPTQEMPYLGSSGGMMPWKWRSAKIDLYFWVLDTVLAIVSDVQRFMSFSTWKLIRSLK